MTEIHMPSLLFHYDFLRPYLRSAKLHERDEGLDVLDTAEHVTTLTLWCAPKRLRAQLHAGEIAPRTTAGFYWGKKRHRLIARDYRDPETVRRHYRRWFEHLSGRPGEHWVLSLDGGVALRPIAEWMRLADEVAE